MDSLLTRDKPLISIVVLTFNALDASKRCIESIKRYSDVACELIVVDNASEADTREYLERQKQVEGIRVQYNDSNRGFAAGCNQGAELALGPVLFFLNNDTVLTQGCLSNLLAALQSGSDVGAVGPRSNHAKGVQGGIFLPDYSLEGIQDFAGRFNHPDRHRWLEVDDLSGYALMMTAAVFEEAGRFEEKFGLGTVEDRELCRSVREKGYRLLCAGDTFLFHEGHRSFIENHINFAYENIKNIRLSGAAADSKEAGPLQKLKDGDLITCGNERYLFQDSHRMPITTAEARQVVAPKAKGIELTQAQLDTIPVGPPVFFVRSLAPDVFLVQGGKKHLLRGDSQRIRRLKGITVLPESELARLPSGNSIHIKGRLQPVHKLPDVLPQPGIAGFDSRFRSAELVLEDIKQALEAGRGYSIVRLGSGEAVVLNQGIYPVMAFKTDYSGVEQPREQHRKLLIDAIWDADLVGITPMRNVFHCAPLIEKLFDHFHIYPRRIASAFVNWDLIGVDRNDGRRIDENRLMEEVLKGRRVAVVGRVASDLAKSSADLGFEVSFSCGLEGFEGIDAAFEELRKHRSEYDLVLVAAGIPAVILCPRLARELDLVAFDFGHAVNYLLNPAFSEANLHIEKIKWRAQRYAQSSLTTGNNPRTELEGKVLRNEKNHLYYMENGRARPLTGGRKYLSLFSDVADVSDEFIYQVDWGIQFSLYTDDLGGLFFLKDGKKIPVHLPVPVIHLGSDALNRIETEPGRTVILRMDDPNPPLRLLRRLQLPPRMKPLELADVPDLAACVLVKDARTDLWYLVSENTRHRVNELTVVNVLKQSCQVDTQNPEPHLAKDEGPPIVCALNGKGLPGFWIRVAGQEQFFPVRRPIQIGKFEKAFLAKNEKSRSWYLVDAGIKYPILDWNVAQILQRHCPTRSDIGPDQWSKLDEGQALDLSADGRFEIVENKTARKLSLDDRKPGGSQSGLIGAAKGILKQHPLGDQVSRKLGKIVRRIRKR